MIAVTVGYDLLFLAHVIFALATITVLIVMRTGAQSIVRAADGSTQAARFPRRRNWAARVLHLLPITGMAMSMLGTSDVSLTRPWIIVGLVCYLAAAGHLEARTLPLERLVSEVIEHDGMASPERGRQLTRSVDTILALIAVALLSMLIQF